MIFGNKKRDLSQEEIQILAANLEVGMSYEDIRLIFRKELDRTASPSTIRKNVRLCGYEFQQDLNCSSCGNSLQKIR